MNTSFSSGYGSQMCLMIWVLALSFSKLILSISFATHGCCHYCFNSVLRIPIINLGSSIS